jgi:membrane-bound lytic murein transglycosylase A
VSLRTSEVPSRTDKPERLKSGLAGIVAVIIAAFALSATAALSGARSADATTGKAMTKSDVRLTPVTFAELPRWAADDHVAAFRAFLVSCDRLAKLTASPKATPRTKSSNDLLAVCAEAGRLGPRINRTSARNFFERHFTPHRVVHKANEGLLTGYYEPIVEGARTPDKRFATPLYRRPDDLVNLVDESKRGTVGKGFTHARQTLAGLVPFPSRADIEQGALTGKGLELVYLADPVDVFFLQGQGSGLVRMRDGSLVRVQYDGKNGHPYRSIGKYLIDNGIIDAARMSMQALAAWLRSDPNRGRAVMWQNPSYIFFRELKSQDSTAPFGVHEIPLVVGRSLAVDTSVHAIGSPIYVTSPKLTHAGSSVGFHRLMVAHDVGSAIKGPERGDIYFGSGDQAGKIAGVTRHPGHFYVLLPQAATGATASAGTAASTVSPAKK